MCTPPRSWLRSLPAGGARENTEKDELAALLLDTEAQRRWALACRLRLNLGADQLDDAMSMWTVELYRRLPSKDPTLSVQAWFKVARGNTLLETCRQVHRAAGGRRGSPELPEMVGLDDLGAELVGDLGTPELRHVRALAARKPEAVAELLAAGPRLTGCARRRHLALRAELAATLRSMINEGES
jgi:hypothetical protein